MCYFNYYSFSIFLFLLSFKRLYIDPFLLWPVPCFLLYVCHAYFIFLFIFYTSTPNSICCLDFTVVSEVAVLVGCLDILAYECTFPGGTHSSSDGMLRRSGTGPGVAS